jgi:hypothetical protein
VLRHHHRLLLHLTLRLTRPRALRCQPVQRQGVVIAQQPRICGENCCGCATQPWKLPEGPADLMRNHQLLLLLLLVLLVLLSVLMLQLHAARATCCQSLPHQPCVACGRCCRLLRTTLHKA